MHINNICKRLYQRTAQPNTCYNILFEKPHACLGHETPMWKQGRRRGIWGAQAIRKTWQSYSLGSNSGSSKPWLLSSEHEEMWQYRLWVQLCDQNNSHNNVLLCSLGWNHPCLLYESSKLVTYLGLVPPTLFRTLGGKPNSLFGSFDRRLELHGLSG